MLCIVRSVLSIMHVPIKVNSSQYNWWGRHTHTHRLARTTAALQQTKHRSDHANWKNRIGRCCVAELDSDQIELFTNSIRSHFKWIAGRTKQRKDCARIEKYAKGATYSIITSCMLRYTERLEHFGREKLKRKRILWRFFSTLCYGRLVHQYILLGRFQAARPADVRYKLNKVIKHRGYRQQPQIK